MNGVVRPRRSAGLAALLGAGAIPELGEYRVVLDPDNVTVGSVHEDFAIEAAAGDIFLLGTHSWRVLKVETGTVRVADAQGMPPTTPFWLGEAPARTEELSAAGLLAARARRAASWPSGDADGARAAVRDAAGVDEDVAAMVVAYLEAGRRALGVLPTTDRLVVERFFDDNEAAQLVVHSPLGGRINRALGLALRKRFCVTFDFELQAAANDDAVTIALGPHHSLPAHRRRQDGPARQGARDPDPGRAPAADARRALALERGARPRDAAGDDGAAGARSTCSAWRPTT